MVTQSTRVSSHNSPYGSSILDRQEGSTNENVTTLWMIWTWIWLFGAYILHATFRAAVHLGQDFVSNFRYMKNNLWNGVGQLFRKSLVQGQLIGLARSHVDADKLIVRKNLSVHQRQTYVFSDSVFCVGKGEMIVLRPGRAKLNGIPKNNHFKDMNRIDGMPTEFEQKEYPGITVLGLLEKIQTLMTDLQCEPEHFKGGIMFMSMYNDTAWEKKQMQKDVNTVHRQLRKMLASSLAVIGLGNMVRNILKHQMVPGIEWQNKCWQISLDPVIRNFVPPVLLQEENYEAKEEKRSQHFICSTETIELLLRTMISANQLSNYGAVAFLFDEVPKRVRARGNPAAPSIWKRWKSLPSSRRPEILPMSSSGETYGKNTSGNSSNWQNTRGYPNCVLMQVWSLSKQDNTSTLRIKKKDNRCNTYAENSRCLEMKRRLVLEDWFSRRRESVRRVLSWWSIQCLSSKITSLFEDYRF